MTIAERREGDVFVLSPTGPLTDGDVSALETRLRALRAEPASGVVFDGAQVGALSGTALRVLLLASRQLARAGGVLVLAGLREKVCQALYVAGFDRDFVLAADLEGGLARAGTPQRDPVLEALAEQLLKLLGHAPARSIPARAPGIRADALLRVLDLRG